MRMLALVATMLIVSAVSAFAADSGVNWEEGIITVEGTGVVNPRAVSPLQGRLGARLAAKADAQRQLLEIVKGVNVDAETTVENMMLTSDVITTRVSGVLTGARIVAEKEINGGYVVTMQMPMYGVSNSIASAVLPHSTTTPQSYPAPTPSVEPSQTSIHVDISVPSTIPSLPGSSIPSAGTQTSAEKAPSGKAYGKYTGLIVDCTGLGLNPVMSPVVKNANGEPIYGHKNLDYDKVVQNGMASYTTDIRKATRAGSNPLIVRAVRLDNHNGNPVLSLADANRVLIENQASGFLDNTNVVFVR